MADEVRYPPEPWNLQGEAYVSAWAVRSADLPLLPSGIRPFTLSGRSLVATAWVDYRPGGVLTYRELLAGVVVRDGLRPGLTITSIWVDSEASKEGARELWAIPKELAEFRMVHEPDFSAAARAGGTVFARSRFRSLPEIPLALPIRGTVVQARGDSLVHVTVKVTARVRLARGSWEFDPNGPLHWLRRYRPVAGAAATGFTMRFGRSG